MRVCGPNVLVVQGLRTVAGQSPRFNQRDLKLPYVRSSVDASAFSVPCGSSALSLASHERPSGECVRPCMYDPWPRMVRTWARSSRDPSAKKEFYARALPRRERRTNVRVSTVRIRRYERRAGRASRCDVTRSTIATRVRICARHSRQRYACRAPVRVSCISIPRRRRARGARSRTYWGTLPMHEARYEPVMRVRHSGLASPARAA